MDKHERFLELCSQGKNPLNRHESPPPYQQLPLTQNEGNTSVIHVDGNVDISYCTLTRNQNSNTPQSYRTVERPGTSRRTRIETGIAETTTAIIICPTPSSSIPKSPQPPRCILPFGPVPRFVTCPMCGERKLTRVEHAADMQTHLLACTLCLVGCFCCACIPYCLPSCKTTMHYCSICNAFLGCYRSH